MAFGDDWTIDTTNKIVFNSGFSTTVYDINDFYSELVDLFDELSYMQYEVPIKAITDYDYQMINGWVFDYMYSVDSGDGHDSHKFLTNGSLTTLGWDAATYADGIRLLTFPTAAGAVASDIGKPVVYTAPPPTDSGILIAFSADGKQWLVRVDDTGDTFADFSEAVSVTGGTGAGTMSKASETGENQWTCIFTIGTIEGVANANPMGQVYIFQDEEPISEWKLANGTRLTNWDRGNDHISVLILILEAGILKGEYPEAGYVYGYLREGGDVYSHFLVNLNAGGIQPLPLGTVNDLNHSTPDYYLLYDAQALAFTVGDIIIGATSFAEAEIATDTDWGTTGVLGLIGVSGAFTDGENILLTIGGSTYAVVNGTLGDVWFAYTDGTGSVAVGATIRNTGDTIRRKVTGKQDDTGTGKMTAQIDTTDTANIAKYYLPIEVSTLYNDGGGNTITTSATAASEAIAAHSDILIQFVNLEMDYDSQDTNFTIGETVTGATSGAVARVLGDTDAGVTGTLILGNWNGVGYDDNEELTGSIGGAAMAQVNGIAEIIHTMDKAFTLGTDEPYDVIIDMNFYDLADAYRHTMAELYEYMKFVTRWDSAFACYKVQERYLRGAVADDGAVQTDETTASRNTTAADMTLLPSGAVDVNDAYYFGQKVEFDKVLINFSQAGVGVWALTWEYWNGAWVAITDGTNDDEGGGFANNFEPGSTGVHTVFWNKPADWAETTVKLITGYWVRARVTTLDAAPGAQPLGTQAWTWDVDGAETGEEYRSAFAGYAEIAVSPYGSYTGTALLGAQGVWAEGMEAGSVQAFTWTDSDGEPNSPPNFQSITITNLVSGDKVGVFRFTAALGEVDKDFYTSGVGNAQGDSTVIITEVPANDTPDAGYIVAVDVSLNNREYSMRYTSWDQSAKEFTLATAVSGSVTTTGSPGATQLIDSAADFGVTEDVQEGDIIYNSTDGSYAHIDKVVSTTELKTTRLQGGTTNDWVSADNYSINTIPYALVSATDYLYVPFIYEVATTTSVSVTVIYASVRPLGIFVRRTEETNPIEPFFLEGEFIATGYSTACIRNDDNIVTPP